MQGFDDSPVTTQLLGHFDPPANHGSTKPYLKWHWFAFGMHGMSGIYLVAEDCQTVDACEY